MMYKASPFIEGGTLSLTGVESIGKEFGTDKNVLQLRIAATKSLGKVKVEGEEEGERVLQEEVITLTGTEQQLGTQLNDWGFELYRDANANNSWGIRELER